MKTLVFCLVGIPILVIFYILAVKVIKYLLKKDLD